MKTDIESLIDILDSDGQKAFIKTVWSYMANGLLTENQFQDLMLEAMSSVYWNGIEVGQEMIEDMAQSSRD